MRLFFLIIFAIPVFSANATNYYFSASGNDLNSGTSPSSPWQTLNKFNSVFASKNPGDYFLFNRGDIFYGKMLISRSGSSGSPITIGAYGTGASPVITGFTAVTAWANLGNNIWESINAISGLSHTNMVAINEINTPMGRTPNIGSFYYYQSHSGTGGNITSNYLGTGINWTGAELALNISTYTIGRNIITSQSGSTIYYQRAPIDEDIQYNNQRFIIQNDPRTLDAVNEWYFNPSTKKIRIYNTVSPTNVQVATIDTLVIVSGSYGVNYITFDGISFRGANVALLEVVGSKQITVQNCDFNFSGRDGIFGPFWGNSTGLIVRGCTFNNANNNSIDISGNFDNALVENNTVKNSGKYFGLGDNGGSGNGLGSYSGIVTGGASTLVDNNTIDSTAFNGIRFYGNYSAIQKNFVTNFCLFLIDGAGIYTDNDATTAIGLKILNNILVGGNDNGIYTDAQTNNVEIAGNTIANCVRAGLFINNDHDMNIHDNTVHNCKYDLWVDNLAYPLSNVSIRNNIFTAKTPSQKTALYNLSSSTIPATLVPDSNYYARPVDDNLSMFLYLNSAYTDISLSNWKSLSGKDSHSQRSPKTLSDTNGIRLEYNASSSFKTLGLDAIYMDVKGNTHNGSITLAPYTSAVLIKSGVLINPPPVANAGSDQAIQLPIDSIRLTGSGVDSNGTIASYNWTKISGPANYVIANPASPLTSVTGLVKGVYQFELQVTDNNGAIGKDTMVLTVYSANIPPVANAGQDQTITLPTNTLTLSGSGNDVDGKVVSYVWTKISGPSSLTITNASFPSTSVTGFVEGVYQFELKISDNNGATSADTIQVTVNPAPNQAPVANAGADQNVTLPVNAATLSGSGSDPDGTIVAYVWSGISGPSGYSITNPSAPVTNVNGLVEGIYTFQLKVTDNNGATGTDIVQITVNAAPNIPPTADAGPDQIITLPLNSITLNGIGADADGSVVNYIWTEISGPSSYNLSNAKSPITDVTGMVQGVYQFQLKVTDNNGAVGMDIIQVTVNKPANMPPVADAGQSQSITLPTDSVTLTGNGIDSDGTVVSYFWTKISGPTSYNIVSPTSSITNVKGLVQGIYQFQLEVTDNSGAKGTSAIQIIVNGQGNMPPVASAGSNQQITLPANTITLLGQGSDSDGSIVSYLWSKLSGPSAYNMVNPASPVTDISGLAQGVYQFELQVTDNKGATGTAVVQITVNAAANISPVADAGPDQTITLPTDSVTLSGSASDSDGTVVSYLWTKLSGPSAYNIMNATSPLSGVTGLSQGVYQFELRVTDNLGTTESSVVQITVNGSINIAPTANAGADTAITLPTNSLTLVGTGTDADGAIVGYSWTKISGPAAGDLINASSATTNITGLVQGIYTFMLEVTDDNGAIGNDTIEVTVNPSLNIPPVANAGPDQFITLPINYITISGTGNDSDGIISTYLWTMISGPSGYNIADATLPSINVTGLVQGSYQFKLEITDNGGAKAYDTMIVVVNAAGNIAPVANAGVDQTITLPVNSASLTGSGTDSDGTVVSYSWTEISGPSTIALVNSTSQVATVNNLVQGIYQFQLAVTDDKGAVGTDIIQVAVNAAPNEPPVADAGLDQTIALPTNSLTLYGSGTDIDGSVTGYVWTKISGPSKFKIVNATSPVTAITNLIEGTYKFQLRVTDNNGAAATDIVHITVTAAANIAPVANAGIDQTITLPTNTVSLTGSATDADGTVVSYQWLKISGPSAYNISDSTSATTRLSGLIEGIYQFELKVADNQGAISTDIVQVVVNAAPNIPPVANAGANQAIILPINKVTLLGSGTDADGNVVSYLWTKISGPSSYSFASSASANTSVTNLVEGTYQFQLQVTDNNGAIGTGIVKVTVNAAANIPPVANAGEDKVITLPLNSVTLSGMGTDADGTIVGYSWAKISGPSSFSIANPSSATTNITSLIQGTYQFQLKVTDNSGGTATDIVQVIVNAAPNQPPVANAGSDQTITLPTNSIVLLGVGTDADGTIASYSWTKISGPSNYTIVNSSGAVANVTGLVQGIYQFQLKITDNAGATATDIMQVIVNAAPNQAPVANAGANQSITLPANSVTLSGSGTDADGLIVSYTWSEISGPATSNIVNVGSAITNVTGLVQGVYQFELKVTDNSGARGRDILTVTVNPAINIAPKAYAGPDKSITLPTNTISLAGSGTDVDGIIASYTWTKISGPSSFNFVNANSALTDVWGLAQGVYKFELKVTDNNGASARDTMQVTVNAANIAPVANAGPDQTISLPVNSVSLSGSGTDPDGSISGYSWKQIEGPSTADLVSSNKATTLVNSLVGGNYKFELTVTDNQGAIGKDTVVIVVAEPRLNLNIQSNSLEIYPNPVRDFTTLEINTTHLNSKLGIVITNMWGKIVYTESIIPSQSNTVKQLNLSNLAKGTYAATIYFDNNEKATIKIIKL